MLKYKIAGFLAAAWLVFALVILCILFVRLFDAAAKSALAFISCYA